MDLENVVPILVLLGIAVMVALFYYKVINPTAITISIAAIVCVIPAFIVFTIHSFQNETPIGQVAMLVLGGIGLVVIFNIFYGTHRD